MIRPYETGVDDDAIVSIFIDASRAAHGFLGDAVIRREAGNVRSKYLPLADTRVFVADNRIAGFISLIGTEIGGLFVDPARQRSGMGHALMRDALARHDRLELDVFVENRIGRSFYARNGFVVIGERLDVQTGHPVLRLRSSG